MNITLADKVILADIYAAREKDPGDISSADLARELKNLGKEVHYLGSFEEIEKFILKNLVNGDLLITMGAGNIVDIGENLLKAWFINIIHNLINKESKEQVVDTFLFKKKCE